MRFGVVLSAISALALVACSGASGDGPSGGPHDGGSDGTTDDTLGGDGIFPIDDGATRDTNEATVADTGVAVDSGTDTFTPPPDASCGTPSLPCCPGDTCSVGYCNGGSCWADPTCVEEASDPGLCADLGVTHVSPSFFERFTIHGRPGATAYRYYIKTSCAGATAKVTPDSPFTLDASGTFSETIENTATADCTNANLGVYEVWVVVDGRESAHHVDSVFNSACATYATCGSVTSACP